MIMSTTMLARAIGPKRRAATPGRGDAAPPVDALESGHARHGAPGQRAPQAVHVHADDPGAAVGAVGLDPYLMAEEGAGRAAAVLERQGEERRRHLLAGRD